MRLQDKYLLLKKRLTEPNFTVKARNAYYSVWATGLSVPIMSLLMAFSNQLGMILGAVAGCIVSIGVGQLFTLSGRKAGYVLSAMKQVEKQNLELYAFNYVNRMSVEH